MPTGYTSDLYDGKKVTFPQFALRCARAFGALIEMRDYGLDEPIPDEFKPAPFYADKIAQASKALDRARALTPMKSNKAALNEYAKAKQEYERAVTRDKALRTRYEAMLAEVKAWTPPTKEHEGLKKFMIEQLEGSIKNDCGMEYYPKPKLKTASEFKAAAIEKASRDLAYYTEENRKEVERVNERNAWVRALRQSLSANVAP